MLEHLSSPIDELQNYLMDNPPQLDSMWDFTIQSSSGWDHLESNMQFHVVDVVIPFPKLTYETAANGEKYYTGIQYPEEFQLTVRETHDPGDRASGSARVMQWWDDWTNRFYDLSNSNSGAQFQKDPANVNGAYRTGVLNLLTDSITIVNGNQAVTPIMRETIQDNLILGIARVIADNAAERMNGALGALGLNIPGVSQMGLVVVPSVLGAQVSTFSTKTIVTTFEFVNLQPVSIEPTSLTYGDGKPLEYRLSLVCDRLNRTQ